MNQTLFISHSSKDEELVTTLCNSLDAHGIDYWISSRDMQEGSDWSKSIVEAIESCFLVVLVHSRHSNDSPHVKREMERAVHYNRPIIPLKTDDSPLSKSMEYFISTEHWFEAVDPPIEAHFSRLAEVVRIMYSGKPEGERLILRYTPKKPYWDARRIVAIFLVAAALIAGTSWVLHSIAHQVQLATQHAAREQELLTEQRQSVRDAEQNAINAKAQTYAQTEFAHARTARLEGEQYAKAGNVSEGRLRWATAVDLFDNAAILAQQRQRVSAAKAAFVDELSSYRPDRYDRVCREWQDLVLLVGQAEELSHQDKHEEAIHAFQRAQGSVVLSIPIYKVLRSPDYATSIDFIETPLDQVLDFLRDLHGLPHGTFVLSTEARFALGDARVTMISSDIPFEDLLRRILKQVRPDLDFIVQNDHSILIRTLEDREELAAYENTEVEPGQRKKIRFTLPPWDEWFGVKERGRILLVRRETNEAIRVLSQAIKEGPADVELYSLLGSAYYQARETKLELEIWTKLIEIAPRNALGYFNRGGLYREVGKHDLAISDLTEAIALDPDDEEKYLWRGRTWMALGEYERGITDFNEMIRCMPSSAAYSVRAWAFEMNRQPERALADYNEAIRRNPKSPQLFLLRGGIWHTFREYEKALCDFREALRLDPQDIEALNGLAWFLCTCPNDSLRNGAEAVRYATSANELSGWKEPSILDTLAAAYAETGEFDEAVSWQQRAAELASDEDKEDFRSRLALYKTRTPFREAPSTPE